MQVAYRVVACPLVVSIRFDKECSLHTRARKPRLLTFMNVEGICPDCLEDEDFSDGKCLEKENA